MTAIRVVVTKPQVEPGSLGSWKKEAATAMTFRAEMSPCSVMTHVPTRGRTDREARASDAGGQEPPAVGATTRARADQTTVPATSLRISK